MTTAISRALRVLVPLAVLMTATFATSSGKAQASTVILAPTTVTVPAGTTFFPSSTGGSVPAGLHDIEGLIDTAQMPTSNSMTVQFEVQLQGDPTWYTWGATTFNGGTHPTMHNPSNTTVGIGTNLSSPYPVQYRVQVDNGPTPSKVTVSVTTN